MGSWQLSCSTDAALQIVSMEVDSSIWTSTVRLLGSANRNVTGVGILISQASAPSGRVSGTELLARLRLRIVQPNCGSGNCISCNTATGAGCSGVQCSVLSLESIVETDVVSPGTPATNFDRFGTGSSSARVVLIQNEVAGVLASLSNFEMVNTALVGGSQVSLPLSLVVVRENGGSFETPTPNEVNCNSADSERVQATCSSIFVDGALESYGKFGWAEVVVAVTANTVRRSRVRVHIWTPALSTFSIRVAHSTLRPINLTGLTQSSAQCATRMFQRTNYEVSVAFTNGTLVRTARVTSIATVSSGDSGIARRTETGVITGQGTAASVGIGSATIIVSSPPQRASSQILASTIVNVDYRTAVIPSGIDVVVATTVTVVQPPSHPLSASNSTLPQLEIVAPNVVTAINGLAGVAVYAAFDDGFRMHIGGTDGVRLSIPVEYTGIVGLVSTSDVSIANSRVLALAGASGQLVNATWQVNCGDSNGEPRIIGTGRGSVDLQLPVASRIEFEQTNIANLVPLLDPLTTAGHVTSAQLRVFAVFVDDQGQTVQRVDVTHSPRILYDVSGAAGRLTVCNSSQTTVCASSTPTATGPLTVSTLTSSSEGLGTITVSLSGTNVTASTNFSILRSARVEVRVHPFPEYIPSNVWNGPNSRDYSMVRLSILDNPRSPALQRRQQGIATVYAVTGGGVSFMLPRGSTGASNFVSFVSGASTPESQVLSVAPSSGIITVANAGSGTTAMEVGCTLSTGQSVVRASLEIGPRSVSVSAIRPPQIAGQVTANQANIYRVQGTQNSSPSRVVASVQFSDGTFHPDIFTTPNVLPGLVSCRSFSPTMVNCSDVQFDGRLTLLANSPTGVSMTLSIAASFLTASFTVGANLIPQVGDFDLGGTGSVPISTARVNTIFSVPVRLNAGTSLLGAAAFQVVYDVARLTVVSVTEGSGWAGGTFESNER